MMRQPHVIPRDRLANALRLGEYVLGRGRHGTLPVVRRRYAAVSGPARPGPSGWAYLCREA